MRGHVLLTSSLAMNTIMHGEIVLVCHVQVYLHQNVQNDTIYDLYS